MSRNAFFNKVPNLSLLFGYVFILLVMGLFGTIQFSSTKNLKAIDTCLHSLTLKLIDVESEQQFEKAAEEYECFFTEYTFYNFYSTIRETEDLKIAETVISVEDMKINLEKIGQILDLYESDLYRSQSILLATFIGLSIILSILLTVSEFDQIKKYEREKNERQTNQKLMELLESERNFIAIELHDDVAQKLSVISQHFDSSKTAEHSELLKRYNSDVILKIRTMAQALRTPDVESDSFQKQLEFLFSDFRSISAIKLHAKFNGLSVFKLNSDKVLHVYRIIQELLANCMKHSKAENVYINVLYVHPLLKVSYNDDGIGMGEITKRKGLGLRSIQYRIKILNAQMETKSDKGHYVKIQIPVEL